METRQSSSNMCAPKRAPAIWSRGARSAAQHLVRAALWLATLSALSIAAHAAPGKAVVLPVDGAISPATADFITRSIQRATREQAGLVVIELDTPGGLDTSMRQIIKAILASPVPVAAFVAPSGARAASAGTYIVYAAHIAAMAPGTNLGAATPIELGGGAGKAAVHDAQSTEARKRIDDAAAYIRGLALMRGRNAAWAERAVREAVSLSASEALEQHVVDLVAANTPDLLRKLDGRRVQTAGGPRLLSTAHAAVETIKPDWRTRVLTVLADPNVALILITIGVFGLFFEFASPGFVLPGVAGAISLLLGLFALQFLPISYTGLALVFLGLAFLIAEAFLPTFGTLGFGGIVAFVAGALMLVDTDVPGYGIPLPVIAALGATGAALVAGISRFATRARKRPVVTGGEAMIGSVGEVIEEGLRAEAGAAPGETIGWARVHGERWRARCATALPPGCRVRVTGRSGLTLTVVPLDARPAGETGE